MKRSLSIGTSFKVPSTVNIVPSTRTRGVTLTLAPKNGNQTPIPQRRSRHVAEKQIRRLLPLSLVRKHGNEALTDHHRGSEVDTRRDNSLIAES